MSHTYLLVPNMNKHLEECPFDLSSKMNFASPKELKTSFSLP